MSEPVYDVAIIAHRSNPRHLLGQAGCRTVLVESWRRGSRVAALRRQGMNSGIRDAHNLAEVVAGRVGIGLLDTYQTERSPTPGR